jgi:prevent-host-death family protein
VKKWQLQEAKNRFSEVVNKTLQEGPQIVTRHGVDSVVILSAKEYKKLIRPETDLVTFFKQSPFYNIQLDFARNKDLPRKVSI